LFTKVIKNAKLLGLGFKILELKGWSTRAINEGAEIKECSE
jgi:hypothetical protein